jgi:hypothetical protein
MSIIKKLLFFYKKNLPLIIVISIILFFVSLSSKGIPMPDLLYFSFGWVVLYNLVTFISYHFFNYLKK